MPPGLDRRCRVRVRRTGAWHDEQPRVAKTQRLLAEQRLWQSGRQDLKEWAEPHDALKAGYCGLELFQFRDKVSRAIGELGRIEFVGARGWPFDHVGKTDAVVGQ